MSAIAKSWDRIRQFGFRRDGPYIVDFKWAIVTSHVNDGKSDWDHDNAIIILVTPDTECNSH